MNVCRWSRIAGEKSVYRNQTRNWHPYDVRNRMRLCNCCADMLTINLETGVKTLQRCPRNYKGVKRTDRSKYNIKTLEDRALILNELRRSC